MSMPIEGLNQDPNQKDKNADWNFVKRAIFRFIFSYLIIYNFPFPVNAFPFTETMTEKYDSIWKTIVPWFGKHILHFKYDIIIFPNGSGDTTYNYVQVLCFLILAAAVTMLWTLLDRKRINYQYLHQWLTVYIRFSLATAMISYGAYKVIKSQFPDPSLDRLLQPVGESSPMGLLWTFMGSSESYNIFTGSLEMLGGLLLIAPNTMILGALLSMGVLANVFMLNMSYDVPVKLYSLHLILMSVFLFAPSLNRLANFFVFNRLVTSTEPRPLFTGKWLNYSAVVMRVLFVLFLLFTSLNESYQARKMYGDLMKKPPLYGVWNVEEAEIDGVVHPPLLTDETLWRRTSFYSTRMSIFLMNDTRLRYNVSTDMGNKKLVLTTYEDKNWRAEFAFTQPQPETLILDGQLDNHHIKAKLHRMDESKFLLTSRGFHWINEYPFNR